MSHRRTCTPASTRLGGLPGAVESIMPENSSTKRRLPHAPNDVLHAPNDAYSMLGPIVSYACTVSDHVPYHCCYRNGGARGCSV